MKYSIIIPTYNHCDDLLKVCVEAIIKYTYLSDIELIIVANGCTDETKGYLLYLESYFENSDIGGFQHVFYDEPLGYSRANNIGIRLSKADKLILLNNDAFLLEQEKSDWLKMLDKPFANPNCGITTVLKIYSEAAAREFAVFFCVMIDRKVFDKIGLLNEEYGKGGGEDTEFCIEAERAGFEVIQAAANPWSDDAKLHVGPFPIYHRGEGTVRDKTLVPDWDDVFYRNTLKLAAKYNPKWYRWKLTNNYERAVFLKDDKVLPRERARYIWANQNLHGKKVLEVGCSTGFGRQFLPSNLEYTGIDYDRTIIEVATNQQWPSSTFLCADINTFELEQYDTIIAFEVIEHLENGLELVEKLKKHCNQLLISVPYKEEPGFWGEHHRLHRLDESNLPGFDYQFIDEAGSVTIGAPVEGINLMICKWPGTLSKLPVHEKPEFPSIAIEGSIQPPITSIENTEKVICSISTRGRYESTLPMAIQSVINQTRPVDKLIIFDDNDEPKDVREMPIYQHLFQSMDLKGIAREWVFTLRKGQHFNHQVVNSMANKWGFTWVWRVDDDCNPEPNVLSTLFSYTSPNLGAVAGAILTPPLPEKNTATGKIENIMTEGNIQWSIITAVTPVDHLHCSFLYRAGIKDFNLGLSRVAHREETLFTYGLKQKGYDLFVVPDAITWHMKNPVGGIRLENDSLFDHDENIFQNLMKYKDNTIVILDNGLGDHIVFKHILPEVKNPVMFTCYADVIPGKSIQEAKDLFGDIDQYNIYKKMDEWQWTGSLEDAFRKLYT